jgi:hypothetical protein
MALTHATDAFALRDILENRQLRTTACDTYKGEHLLYFFYGRPSYRCNISVKNNGLLYYAPICLLIGSALVTTIKRILPFDSGGFVRGLFSEHVHHKMAVRDFELHPSISSADSLIRAFFRSAEAYYMARPELGISIPPSEYEAQAYYDMITDTSKQAFDDRVSAIEVHSDKRLFLREGLLLAIVLPSALLEDSSILNHLAELRATPLTYDLIGRFKSNEYTSEIFRIVRDFYRSRGI